MKTKTWDKSVPSCINCKTKRFPRSSRNFCNRCYFWIRHIERLNSDKYRSKGRHLHAFSKSYRIKKANAILKDLALLETGVNHSVDTLLVEELIHVLVKATRSRSSWVSGNVRGILDSKFSNEQKSILYLILLDIVENLPSLTLRHRLYYYGLHLFP